jgi:ABC-type sugar transport system substrate-binding protein
MKGLAQAGSDFCLWSWRAARRITLATAILGSAAAGAADAEDGPIIAVSGPLSWPFFAAVKQGFDDARSSTGSTSSMSRSQTPRI